MGPSSSVSPVRARRASRSAGSAWALASRAAKTAFGVQCERCSLDSTRMATTVGHL
jgi:hypothetical protein